MWWESGWSENGGRKYEGTEQMVEYRGLLSSQF